jgi:WD40 repeat protein
VAGGADLTMRSLFGINPVATKSSEIADQFDAFSLAFTPDGTRLATGSPNSEEVHIWDWRSRPPHLIQRLSQGGNGTGSSMNGLRYSPNGDLLASAHGRDQEDRIVRIWKISTGTVADDIADPNSDAFPLTYAGLQFSSDDRFLIRTQMGGSYMKGSIRVTNNSFIVHDTATWQPVWALSTAPVFVTGFGASPDGHYAVIAGPREVGTKRDPLPSAEDVARGSCWEACNAFSQHFRRFF